MTGTVMTPAFGEAKHATTIATSTERSRRVHGVACTDERVRFLTCSIFGVEVVTDTFATSWPRAIAMALGDAAT